MALSGKNVVFVANMLDAATFAMQWDILVVLSESDVASLTVVVSYFPFGTMERVERDRSVVATANTRAAWFRMLKGNVRAVFYDLHTLQNEFYFPDNTTVVARSAVFLCLDAVPEERIVLVFPDQGAQKRFSSFVVGHRKIAAIVCCTKERVGEDRVVRIAEGVNHLGNENMISTGTTAVYLMDDIVQSGGTLLKCAETIKTVVHSDVNVGAICIHGIFSVDSLQPFVDIFHRFIITNSVHDLEERVEKYNAFKVVNIAPELIKWMTNHGII